MESWRTTLMAAGRARRGANSIRLARATAGPIEAGAALLERVDVADQCPAIVLGEVLPGGHRAPAVGDLPEQLAVRLILHSRRGPVGRLRIQRDRRGAIALSLGPVARRAVDLGQLRALLDDLLVVRQRVLLRLIGVRSHPRTLRERSASEREDRRDRQGGGAGADRWRHGRLLSRSPGRARIAPRCHHRVVTAFGDLLPPRAIEGQATSPFADSRRTADASRASSAAPNP